MRNVRVRVFLRDKIAICVVAKEFRFEKDEKNILNKEVVRKEEEEGEGGKKKNF